jgi:O-antigen ligase
MTNALNHIPRYCILFLLVFAPLARAAVQPWSVTAIHIVTLIAFTAYMLVKIINDDWKLPKTKFDKPIIALVVLIMLSTFFSVHWPSSLWTMGLIVNYIVIFYIAVDTFKDNPLQPIYIILAVGLFLAIFGIIKNIGFNPFFWWEYPDLAKTNRLTATYGNPNHLAGFMEMALPLTAGLMLSAIPKTLKKVLLFIAILFALTLLLTLSRGGWFTFMATLGVMSIFVIKKIYHRHRRSALLIACLSLLIVGLALANTDFVDRILTIENYSNMQTGNSRTAAWSGAVQMIKSYPVLGSGPGTFALVFTQYQLPGAQARFFQAHNDYLDFTSQIGLLLIPLLIWIVLLLYGRHRHNRLLVGILTGITALLLHSIFDFNLQIPANALLFTVLLSLFATINTNNVASSSSAKHITD